MWLDTGFAFVDRLTNRIGSYRLLLYALIATLGAAIGLSFAGQLPFSWYSIVLSAVWLVLVCRVANRFFARLLKIDANSESDLITALILTLILNPGTSLENLVVLASAGILAMGSKYLLVWQQRHIFNPAAFGAVAVSIFFDKPPSWWVGTALLTPIVLIGGVLVLRKLKRFTTCLTFLGAYLFLLLVGYLWQGNDLADFLQSLRLSLVESSLLFFAVVMLIEPMTSPTVRKKAMGYGGLVGVLYAIPGLRLNINFGPEVALLAGNLFSYLIAPNFRLNLRLVRQKLEAKEIYSFIFDKASAQRQFNFHPGQFMEWSLAHPHSDSRGVRRYFTISTSPTEDFMMMTSRIPEKSSSYKQALKKLKPGEHVYAAQVGGDFILPTDPKQKLAFLAGGVGITPFRSMVKYLLDTNSPRSIILLYGASQPDEFAFGDLFETAGRKIGLKTTYVVSGPVQPHTNWQGRRGLIDQRLIKQEVPDFGERIFYLSGPLAFVRSAEKSLLATGVSRGNIRIDYFPGYVA